APSGRILDPDDQMFAHSVAHYGIIRYSEELVVYGSGIKRHWYVSVREEVTDNPYLARIVGRMVRDAVRKTQRTFMNSRRPCLIGVPQAGDILAQAAAMAVSLDDMQYGEQVICWRRMRKEPKEYGLHPGRYIDGEPDPQRHQYAFIENTVTTGDSVLQALVNAERDGYPVHEMPIYVFVDSGHGGVERIEQEGFLVTVIYHASDLVWFFACHNLWPEEWVKTVRGEMGWTW
ncbi:MAG: hypothetical protein Q8R13_01315, partial [bacterium]|nr:hypothetical protein [bacterium]